MHEDFFTWYPTSPAFRKKDGTPVGRRSALKRAKELKLAIIEAGHARIIIPAQANAAITAAGEALANELQGKRRGRGRPRAGG